MAESQYFDQHLYLEAGRLRIGSGVRVGRGLQALVGWSTLLLTLGISLVQGGNQPVVWVLFGLSVLFLFVIQIGVMAAGPPVDALRRAAPLAFCYGLVLTWGLAQILLDVPLAMAHPFWTIAPEGAHPRIGADPIQGLHTILRLASYGMVGWIIAVSALGSSRAWSFITIIALFSAALAAYGLVATASGNNPLIGLEAGADVRRSVPVTASFVNRNAYATYAAFGLLTNLALFLRRTCSEEDRARTRSDLRGFLERFFDGGWIFALGALLCTSAVALTESRAGGLAAVLGILVLLATGGRRRSGRALPAGLMALVLLGFVAVGLGGGTLERLMDNTLSAASFSERLHVYGAIIDATADRLWLGQGVGAFEDTFRAHVPMEAARAHWDVAHSSYLENVYEMGAPAAFLFYAVIAGVVLRLRIGLASRRQDTLIPGLALAVTVTAGVHATVDFSLQMPACSALFAALLGLGWAQSFRRRDRRRYRHSPGKGPARLRAPAGGSDPR